MGIQYVLNSFGINAKAEQFGNGHINDTYVVRTEDNKYILQKINKYVFKNPPEVMENIMLVTEHIKKKIKEENINQKTIDFLRTKDGLPYCFDEESGEYFRMYVFIDHVISCESADNPSHLYNAARAFGKFQDMLSDFPAEKLHESIPGFHHTANRYKTFKKSVDENKSGRAHLAQDEIKFVLDREKDASVVLDGMADGSIPVRVTHNDTKLNNVLLDEKTGEGLCVIDLDTIMPGSLLYDFGDALRFAGSTGAEDEKNLDLIHFDEERFRTFTKGFLEMLPSATEREIELLPFSVKLLTLECGLRFLADYLDGDIYFKTEYPEHNLVRARTQFKLVKEIEEKDEILNSIVKEIRKSL